ncbi:alpha/beta hydrolase [Streptomyces gelaticus]|uniref:alpha/beta hydrolase n=1 Tax=Streptomyces gelaticus TaxID=285446 RepID=UPI0035709647
MEREAATDTVVLIHGLWMTPLSWEHWATRYEQRGLKVITPGYPGIEPGPAGVEALRNDPSPLAGLGVREVFGHLTEVIDALGSEPVIMGHSFGGAFVQLLLDAGYGTAGVSIDGAAVKGVKALPFSEIKATFPVLHNPRPTRTGLCRSPRRTSTTPSRTTSPCRSRRPFTTATPSRSPAASCSRAASRTSPRTQRRPATSPTTTVRRCCSSPAATTTSCRP